MKAEWLNQQQQTIDGDVGEMLLDTKRILLVIYFNIPHYDTASKLDALYRSSFFDIVYCGPENSTDNFWPLWQSTKENIPFYYLDPDQVRFVNYSRLDKDAGQINYSCFSSAYHHLLVNKNNKKNNTVEGILVMADDVIVNFWTLASNYGKQLDKCWLQFDPQDFIIFDTTNGNVCLDRRHVESCQGKDEWLFSSEYTREVGAFYNELGLLAYNNNNNNNNNYTSSHLFHHQHQLQKPSPSIDGGFWRKCLRRLLNQTQHHRNRMLGKAGGDIFYVSKQYFEQIDAMFQLLSK